MQTKTMFKRVEDACAWKGFEVLGVVRMPDLDLDTGFVIFRSRTCKGRAVAAWTIDHSKDLRPARLHDMSRFVDPRKALIDFADSIRADLSQERAMREIETDECTCEVGTPQDVHEPDCPCY